MINWLSRTFRASDVFTQHPNVSLCDTFLCRNGPSDSQTSRSAISFYGAPRRALAYLANNLQVADRLTFAWEDALAALGVSRARCFRWRATLEAQPRGAPRRRLLHHRPSFASRNRRAVATDPATWLPTVPRRAPGWDLRPAHSPAQFSTFNPATRLNSRVLLVTTVRPSARAWAAISRSMLPIGVPARSNPARTVP